MYTPPHFREDRLPVLHEAIRTARLATLVTMGGEGIGASHVPVILDAAAGAYGTLYGHFSRANSQWRDFDPAVPALAIVTGPDAYVSPSWYPSKTLTGKGVPTWNYVAVHAYGTLEVFDDVHRLREVVTRLTEAHEAGRGEPWAVSDAPPDFIQSMLTKIVGFKLPIDRLEGKAKLSQNRSPEDRRGVIDGLRAEGGEREGEVAAAMAEREG